MKNIFGIEADDKELKGKTSGEFGLNAGATVAEFAFLDKKAGEEGVDNDFMAVDLNFQVKDRLYYSRHFLNQEVFGKDQAKLNPGDEGYEVRFWDTYVQTIAVVKHTLGALGVSKDAIDQSLSVVDLNPTDQFANLVTGLKAMMAIVPANYKQIPVDVFLEYQWQIGKDNKRTFPTVPKNMKGGAFVVPAMAGKWTEVLNDDGLSYINASGAKHAFSRDKAFMESPKGYEQTEAGVAATNASNAVAQGPINPVAAAAAATWGQQK